MREDDVTNIPNLSTRLSNYISFTILARYKFLSEKLDESGEHSLGFVLILVVVFGVKESVVVLRCLRSHSSVLLNRSGFRDHDVSEKKEEQSK